MRGRRVVLSFYFTKTARIASLIRRITQTSLHVHRSPPEPSRNRCSLWWSSREGLPEREKAAHAFSVTWRNDGASCSPYAGWPQSQAGYSRTSRARCCLLARLLRVGRLWCVVHRGSRDELLGARRGGLARSPRTHRRLRARLPTLNMTNSARKASLTWTTARPST